MQMIQVVFVNSPYNAERPSDREYLASTILALMKNDAVNDPGLRPIVRSKSSQNGLVPGIGALGRHQRNP